jgi:hypothetical protein
MASLLTYYLSAQISWWSVVLKSRTGFDHFPTPGGTPVHPSCNFGVTEFWKSIRGWPGPIGVNTSSFTSSTFIVNASNLLPCLLVCFKLQKEIQSIGLRKSSPPDWKSWSVIGGRPPTSGSKGFLVKYTEVFPRTGNLIRYSAQILAIS